MEGDLKRTLRLFDTDIEGAGEEEAWLALYKKRRRDGAMASKELKARATENHQFAAPGEEQLPLGKTTDEGANSPKRRRKFALMSINEVHPVIATMCGRKVMDRLERRYIPRRPSVRGWDEKLSTWDRAVVDNCHADQEESMIFRNGPGIAGVSWGRVHVDYLEDPEGMLFEEEVSLWQMLWDANARKKNLTDRDWHIHGEWFPIQKFKAMWPKKVGMVRSKLGQESSDFDIREGSPREGGRKIPWQNIRGWHYDKDLPFLDSREKEIWVERYEWREPGAIFFVAVPAEGLTYEQAEELVAQGQSDDQVFTIQEMSPKAWKAYDSFVEQETGEPVPDHRRLRKERMIYRYAYLAGDVVLEEGDIPIGTWTYEAETGYPYTQEDRVDWRSMTDIMRTPQIWINIFLTTLVKYMQVNPKGVLFAERGVFRNRSQGLQQFSSAGGFVEMEPGSLARQNPPFLFHSGSRTPMEGFVQGMLSFAQELLPRSVGFNMAALGQLGPDLRRISGTVVEHVRDTAVAAHAELYDSHALFRQRIGMIFLRYLGRVLGLEHLKRVIGEEGLSEDVVDPETGQKIRQPLEPPPDLLEDASWAVAVEETKPAPDRMRFFWESLTESGALQIMLTPDAQGVQALSAEDVAELAPDIPEERRQKMLERIAMQRQAVQQAAQEQPQQVAA